MFRKILISALLILTVAPSAAQEAPPPPAEKAKLTIYRTKGWVGGLVGHVFTIDGKRIAKLKPHFIRNTSGAKQVGTGEHQFSIYLEEVARADADADMVGYKLVKSEPTL